jgi:outer membrane protein TolC
VRRDAAIAWLDLYYLQRKEALFAELDRENAILAQTVKAQIANGRAQAADAVAPQQEAAQIADRRDDLSSALAQARSRLRQFVGSAADGALAGDPPSLGVDAQHLREHLHQHPELLAFAAETRKAEAEVSEAKSMKTSDWGVELAYQRRAPQFGNMVSIQFTFDLPVSPSTRQEPLIVAKQRELDRIDAERENMLREHTRELDSDLAEYAALSRQLERARHTTLPLLEQKVMLQTASYQGGKGDLAAVLMARRECIDQRLRIIDLENSQARVAARLYFAYGEGAQ